MGDLHNSCYINTDHSQYIGSVLKGVKTLIPQLLSAILAARLKEKLLLTLCRRNGRKGIVSSIAEVSCSPGVPQLGGVKFGFG